MKFIIFLFVAVLYMHTAHAGPAEDAIFAAGLEAYDGGDYTEARANWSRASHQGHVDSMTALADLMMRGQGGPVDQRGAIAWYRKAAQQGDATASLSLGVLAMGDPEGPVHDYLAAFVWFSISAKQGNAWAKGAAAQIKGKLRESERAMADRFIRKNILPNL